MDPSLEEHQGYQPHMDAKYIERIRRERYLLTRKTWRFMSAAGRKLIPDDVPDPPTDEDLRRIEEHFQEVCRNAESYILYDPDAAREGSETEDDEFDEVQSPGYSSGDGGGGSGGFGTRFIGSHHRTGGSIPLPGQTRLHWTGLPGTGLSMSGNYQHQGSYPTSALPQHKKTHKTQQVLGNSASNRASFLLQSPSAGLAPLNHELRQSRSHPQVPADIHSAAGPIHVPAKRSSSHHLTSSSSPASRHGLAPSVSQENLARRGVSSRPKSSVMPPYYGLGSQPPALRFHRPSIPLGSTGAGYPGEDSFRVSPDPFARFQDSSSLLHQMSGSHDASSPHRSFLSEDHSTAFPASRQAHPTAIPFDRIPFIPNRGVFDPQKGTYVHTTASFDPRIHFDPTLLLFDRGDTSHDFWMSDYPDHPALKLLDWVKLRHIEQPAGGGVGVDRKRMKRVSRGTQTLPIYDPDALGEDGRLKRMHIEEEVLPSERDRESKRSSADSGLSESTLETIKRYFKLVRRNSKSEKHKTDKFKKVNYDHSLRDIKAKGDLSMTVDDGNNKGCQVNEPIPLVSHQGIDGRKASPSRQHSDSTSSPSCPTSPRYSIACDEALPLREGVIKGSDDPHRVSASDTGHQSQSQISSPRSSVEIEFGDEFFPASGASTPLSSPAMVFSPVTSPTPSTTPGVQSGPTSPISKSASFPYGGDAQSLQVAQTQDLLLQHICLQASFLQQQIQQRLASSRTSGGATGLTPSQMSQAVQAAQSIALQMVMEGTLPSAQLPTVPETKKSQQQPSTTQKKSTSSVSSTSSSTVTSQKTVGSTTSGRISARLFKSRSKSNVRSPSASDASHCSWKPVANSPRCWTDGIHQVTLTETTLSSLTEAERRELQHIALAQLRDPSIPLPIQIDIPKETDPTQHHAKTKRRPYLLKRRAQTTGIRAADYKNSHSRGQHCADDDLGCPVFGAPLRKCVEEGEQRLQRSRKRSMGDNGGRRLSTTSTGPQDIGRNEEIEGLDGPRLVPKIVQQCIKYLEANGLHTVGIFRVGPSRKRVRELREDLDHGRDLSPSGHHCPHDVAAIMKEYFRDLPDPLLTKELYQAFIHTQRVLQASLQVQILRGLIQLLPPCNQDTLECLLRFLNKVSRNADDIRTRAGDFIVGNKMDSHNLATLFAPNVFHPPDLGATEEATAERLDAINTLRSMIDQDQELFKISPDLLHGIYLRLLEKSPGSLELIFRGKIASHLEECDPDLLDAEPLLESYTSDCSRSATVGDIPMLLRWKLGRGPAPEGVRRERSGRDETGTPSPSSSLPRRPKEEDGGGWFRRRDKSSSTTASGGREASLSSISSSGGDVTPVLSGPLSDENRQRWFRRGKEDKRLRRERSKTQGDIVYSAPDSAFQQYHHLTGEAAKSTSESEISTIHRPLLLSSSMPVDQRQRSSSDKTITSSQYQQLPLGEDGQVRFVTRTAGLLVPQAVDVSRRRSSPELDAPPLLGSSGGGGLFTSSLRVPVRYQSPDIPFIELGAEEMTATADLPSPPPRGPPAESPAPPKKGGPHLHAADHASAGGGHSTLARFFSTSEAPSDPTEKRAEVKGPPPVSTEKRTEVKGPPPVSTEKRTEVKGAPPVSRSATTSSVPHIKKGGGSLRKKEGGARKEAPPPSAVGVEGVASSSSSSGKWKRWELIASDPKHKMPYV